METEGAGRLNLDTPALPRLTFSKRIEHLTTTYRIVLPAESQWSVSPVRAAVALRPGAGTVQRVLLRRMPRKQQQVQDQRGVPTAMPQAGKIG